MSSKLTPENGFILTPSGGTVYIGHARDLFEQTRREIRELCVSLGSLEIEPPGLVETSVLKKVGYLRDFPHHLSWIMHLSSPEAAAKVCQEESELPANQDLSHSGCCLPSTVCHGLYSHLPLEPKRQLWTAEALCYRREGKIEIGRRLGVFHMREIIVTGEHDAVLQELERILQAVLVWMKKKKLDVVVEQAQDPFFKPETNPRSQFQKILAVKREIKCGDLAVASFNFHHNGIMKALRGEEQVYSACVAFGLDRVVSCLFSSAENL